MTKLQLAIVRAINQAFPHPADCTGVQQAVTNVMKVLNQTPTKPKGTKRHESLRAASKQVHQVR